MQPLSTATNRARAKSSEALLDAIPPVMWFIRKQIEQYRAKNLSVSQYRVLCVLSHREIATASEISLNLGMDLPLVSRLVTRLTESGLVKSVACSDDRRCKKIALTKSGKDSVEACQTQIRKELALHMGNLTPDQCDQIQEAMTLLESVFSPDAE